LPHEERAAVHSTTSKEDVCEDWYKECEVVDSSKRLSALFGISDNALSSGKCDIHS
jgi:hypothetical protein